MFVSFIFLIIGLVIITWAADKFVEGAAAVSQIMGVSPLLIGLTIVALGTSAPEIFVAIVSSYKGNTGLAIGNALGSNIANISLVLGLCALISPISVQSRLLKREYLILFCTTCMLWFLLSDSYLSIIDGFVLSAGCITLIFWFIKQGLSNPKDVLANEYSITFPYKLTLSWAILYLTIGIILLPISSNIIVNNAVSIAKYFNVSDLIIGLTIVAIGTSLPEIITAAIASIKKEHDLIIGNIIGSNLFNIFAVLPFPAFISPGPLDSSIQRDLMMVCLTTILLFLFTFTFKKHGTINRIEGFILLFSYISYISYLAFITTVTIG